MKVLFIQFSGIQESIGVAVLAATLEKAGHQVNLILMSHCKDLKKELSVIKPDLIAFSVNTGAHREVQELSRFLRKQTGIKTIIGGPHATFFADDVAASDCFDYICRGEGEIALIQLVDSIERRDERTDIPGIWFRKGTGWIKNEIGHLIEDLDSVPMPKREIYYKYNFIRNLNMKRFITGLGCPFHCAFCFNANLINLYKGKGRYVRRKSVDRVVEEILYVQKLSSLTRVHFSDDLFTIDKKWLMEFAERYRTKVGIPFSCGTRLDCEADIIDILAEAGCCAVQVGYESGSPRVRRELLRKHWTNEQAAELVAHFRKHKIPVMSQNMIALPGETMGEILETIDWNDRIGFDYIRVGFFTPYPSLDLTEQAKSMSLLESDHSLGNFYPNSAHPEFMKERTKELSNLLCIFYFAVKLKRLRGWILNTVIKRDARWLFTMFGWINLLQEFSYFKLHLFPALSFFHNTLGSVWGFRWGAWPATRILGSNEQAKPLQDGNCKCR